MNAWLHTQLDYLAVVYGLIYFFLAIAARALQRQRVGTPAWGWLVLFGGLHGAALWLEALLHGSPWPLAVQWHVLLRLGAFLCLLEFGRASLAAPPHKFVGPWLPLPLLPLVAVFAGGDSQSLLAIIRYAVGWPAALLAAWALHRHARTCTGRARRQLGAAAGALAAYAVLAGLICARPPWPGVAWLNEEDLGRLSGLPLQVWRALAILAVAVPLWWHYRRTQAQVQPLAGLLGRWYYLRYSLPVVGALLAAGWLITWQVGRTEETRLHQDLLARTQLLAVLFDGDRLGRLRGSPDDRTPADLHASQAQLMALHRADGRARHFYLLGLKPRQAGVCLADSEPAGAADGARSGGVLAVAAPEVQAAILAGTAVVTSPWTDRWGTWISGLAPIRDAAGRVQAWLGQDLSAADWTQAIAARRMWPNLTIMLMMLMLFGAFLIVQRLQSLADRLAESEEKYRSLFESSRMLLALLDAETLQVLDVNPAAAAFYGYPRERMLGMAGTEFSRRTQAELCAAIQAATDNPLTLRGPHRLADGSLRTVEASLSPLTVRGRRLVFLVMSDVTGQERAERALQENEARLRRVYDAMNELLLIGELAHDAAGQAADYRIVDGNASLLRFLGKARPEVVGRPATQAFGLAPPFLAECAAVLASGQPACFETFFAPRAVQLAVSIFTLEPGRFVIFAADITARRQAEEQLRLQSAALSAAANGIAITDRAGRILWVNPAFMAMTGYALAEVRGRTLDLLRSHRHPPEFYAGLDAAFEQGQIWRGELINRRKDGRLYTEEMTVTPVVDSAGAPTHFIKIMQDVTDQRELQQQFLQAQKLESIGRLAAGIAHDFNNQLQGILGFSDLLCRALPEADERRGDVEAIRKAAYAAADLTRQLMLFGRRQPLETRVVDLNRLIQDGHKMYRRLAGEDITIELALAPDLARVKADPGQLEQVVMNLLINARDAMPRGGRVAIRTYPTALEACDVARWPDARPGAFSVLAITDTGVGIPPEVMAHIFEPFFTTKEKSRGTGLGLATVYGIARQHNGWVHVYSQPGTGSTFKLYLPALVSAAPAGPADRPAAHREIDLAGRGQRILLVEDEHGVRELVLRILRRNNYVVTAAASVAEALRLHAAAPVPFDLLFSDVVLPDGNGLEIVEQLQARQPGLRVVLASGYTDERSRWPAIQARRLRFIAKPYAVAALLRMVHDALTAAPMAG